MEKSYNSKIVELNTNFQKNKNKLQFEINQLNKNLQNSENQKKNGQK